MKHILEISSKDTIGSDEMTATGDTQIKDVPKSPIKTSIERKKSLETPRETFSSIKLVNDESK